MRIDHDRRRLLKSAGTAGTMAVSLSLAGCSSGSGTSDGGGGGGDETTTTTTESDDDSGEEWTETSTVDMTDGLKFDPKRIKVSAGTEVTWENPSGIGHTVTAYDDEIPDGSTYFASGGFDGEQAARDGYPDEGNVTSGNSYSHTFETEGTYKYFCIPHEMSGMIGYVQVE